MWPHRWQGIDNVESEKIGAVVAHVYFRRIVRGRLRSGLCIFQRSKLDEVADTGDKPVSSAQVVRTGAPAAELRLICCLEKI